MRFEDCLELKYIDLKCERKSLKTLCNRGSHGNEVLYRKHGDKIIENIDGGGGKIRTFVDLRRQIYSLLPLTARPSLHIFYEQNKPKNI